MNLAKITKNALFISIFRLFFISSAMEIKVAMNEGKTVTLAQRDSVQFTTDQLKGCVVTLLHIEHTNRQRTVTMCHFSHDKKSDNQSYLNAVVAQFAQKNISKVSCCIISPGIKEFNRIKPVLDPEWKHLIVSSINNSFSDSAITIKPYLFNIKDSAVQYKITQDEQKVTITNNSSQEDTQNKNQLLQCHNFIQPSFCQKWAPLMITVTGMAAYLVYQMN